MNKPIIVQMTPAQLAVVLQALADRPYREVADLIYGLSAQRQAHALAEQKAAAANDARAPESASAP